MNRLFAIVVLSLLLPASSVAEAASGSRYLTLDNWAYEGIRLLQSAGYLEGLSALVQPYHRDEVAREVQALDPDRLSPALAHWARLLQKEFAGEGGDAGAGVRAGTWIGGGARASTSARADPLRPLGEEGNLWPYGRAAGWVVTGPAALEVVLLADAYLDEDPDGIDPQRRAQTLDLVEWGVLSRAAEHRLA